MFSTVFQFTVGGLTNNAHTQELDIAELYSIEGCLGSGKPGAATFDDSYIAKTRLCICAFRSSLRPSRYLSLFVRNELRDFADSNGLTANSVSIPR